MSNLVDPPASGPAGHAVGTSQFAAALQESDLHPSLKLLLFVLAWNGPKDGSNRYRINKKLAKACSLSERYIQILRKEALSLGWLISEPRPGRSSLLQLALPTAVLLASNPDSQPSSEGSRGRTG